MKREDEWNEYKRTTGELNEGMMSISAILNKHRKGTLFFGLRNDGTPVKFEINDSAVRDVSRKIYEAIKPQIFPVIKTVEIDGIEVIRVDFHGDDIPYSAFGKYYIRVADEDRELTPAELRKLMIAKEYEDNWESRLSDETADDVDEKTLKRFFSQAVQCGRLPEMEYDKTALLERLNVLRAGHLTNAGRVLFSRNMPVTLKLAVFATQHKDTFLDIVTEEGNILSLIDEAVKYVIKNIRWRVEPVGDGIHRNEIPEIPVDALREAIVNSFAHARYDLPVQHEVSVFSNRIAITNPGSFANDFTPDDFYTQDIHSYLRNETIAHTLYLSKGIEAFGSGLKRIYSLCHAQGVSVSYVNNDTDFTFMFSRVDRNSLPSDGTLNGTEKGTETKALTNDENSVLEILMKDPYCTSEDIAESIGKSLRTVKRILASLKSKKLIERIGSTKTGYWKTN